MKRSHFRCWSRDGMQNMKDQANTIPLTEIPHLPSPLRTDVQLYVQVYDVLYNLIHSGAGKPGDLIPGEVALAAHFGVSRGTVRQAIQYLEEDGLLTKHQGRGTEITDRSLRSIGGLQNFSDVCRAFCTVPITSTRVTWTISGCGGWLSEQLHLSKGTLMVNFDIIYFVGPEESVALSQRLVPAVWLERCSIDPSSPCEMERFATELVPQLAAHSQSELMIQTKPMPEISRSGEIPYFSLSELVYDGENRAVGHFKNYLRGDSYRLYLGRRQGPR